MNLYLVMFVGQKPDIVTAVHVYTNLIELISSLKTSWTFIDSLTIIPNSSHVGSPVTKEMHIFNPHKATSAKTRFSL